MSLVGQQARNTMGLCLKARGRPAYGPGWEDTPPHRVVGSTTLQSKHQLNAFVQPRTAKVITSVRGTLSHVTSGFPALSYSWPSIHPGTEPWPCRTHVPTWKQDASCVQGLGCLIIVPSDGGIVPGTGLSLAGLSRTRSSRGPALRSWSLQVTMVQLQTSVPGLAGA